jgi:hypothetical protein
MEMIGLNGQSKDCPPFLLAFLLNQLLASFSYIPNQHGLSPSWTPDKMVHNEVNMVLIPLIFKCLFHGHIIHDTRQECKSFELECGTFRKPVGHFWLKPHLTARAKAATACGGLKPYIVINKRFLDAYRAKQKELPIGRKPSSCYGFYHNFITGV